MGAASWLACAMLVAGMVRVVVGVGLLRDPGFDATWKAGNYTEAQRGWHPFVNGFHPSANPKLHGTASLGISSTWPAGAFQFVPGANLPSARQYAFAAWTLVDSTRGRKPSDELANVTIDVAYIGGGADSFTASLSTNTSRSYRHGLAEQESEQDWAAQRHTVWKEEWQQHCFTFALDGADQVKSITLFLVSTHQHHSPDAVQLWVDQADLYPADDPAIAHANCTQLAAVEKVRDSMNDRYQMHVATCASEYVASPSDVTLVTHLSISQLPLLNDLATNWKGPISAAVLIPNRSSLADLISAHKFDPALREWTTLHAVYPNNGKDRPQSYPGGFLRTVASDAAATTHVLHVGVNYLPATRLRSELAELMQNTTKDGEKVVYVVPSFAPHWDVNAATIPISKGALAEHLRHGRVSQVRGSGYRGFNDKDESDERTKTTVSSSDLHSPFVVLPKTLSRFDETLEGKCEMELDALKVLLDMDGHSFVYLPRGYVLRTSPEPSPQSCWSSDLGEWRAWYAWLVSAAIEHGVSPVEYRYRPLGEPYARGRGITGVVSLILDREPLFAWCFLGSCALTLAVVVGRILRERQRDLAWVLPTHKGE